MSATHRYIDRERERERERLPRSVTFCHNGGNADVLSIRQQKQQQQQLLLLLLLHYCYCYQSTTTTTTWFGWVWLVTSVTGRQVSAVGWLAVQVTRFSHGTARTVTTARRLTFRRRPLAATATTLTGHSPWWRSTGILRPILRVRLRVAFAAAASAGMLLPAAAPRCPQHRLRRQQKLQLRTNRRNMRKE